MESASVLKRKKYFIQNGMFKLQPVVENIIRRMFLVNVSF